MTKISTSSRPLLFSRYIKKKEAVLTGQGGPIGSRVIHQKIWRQRIIDAKGLVIICRLGHTQIEWWDKDSFQGKCPWRNSNVTFSEVITDHRSRHSTRTVLWAEVAIVFEDYRTKMYQWRAEQKLWNDSTSVSTMFIKSKLNIQGAIS